MADDTFTEPDQAPAGSTYEVYEYTPGAFGYHIFAPGPNDGSGPHVLWGHQSGGYVEDAPDGEPTYYHRDGTRMDRSWFKTEKDAHAYCRSKGALCRTVFVGGHPDPEVQGWLADDLAVIAAAVAALGA